MQMIHIDDHLADLRAVEQGLIGTFENVSLDMCAIIDRYFLKIPLVLLPGSSDSRSLCMCHGRCVPNPCEHGGYCSQTWDMFTCNCSGSGYTGATCHTCRCTHTRKHNIRIILFLI